MKTYTNQHAKAGLNEKLPEIDVFQNSFKDYEITIVFPEFTSICPRTGLPDFAKITIKYVPQKYCLELKSLKLYFTAYRNLGIFNENVVNRVLKDIVAACKPKRAEVIGEFTSRGGLLTEISSRF